MFFCPNIINCYTRSVCLKMWRIPNLIIQNYGLSHWGQTLFNKKSLNSHVQVLICWLKIQAPTFLLFTCWNGMNKTTIFGGYAKEHEGIKIIWNGVNNRNRMQAQNVLTLNVTILTFNKLETPYVKELTIWK